MGRALWMVSVSVNGWPRAAWTPDVVKLADRVIERVLEKRTPMKIKAWHSPHEQMCNLGRHSWSVPRLFELARELPAMDVPLDHLSLFYTYEKLTLREMVMHMLAVNAADLTRPIILDEDGELMDGRHRLMKAMLLGNSTIRAVRFDENPTPDKVAD